MNFSTAITKAIKALRQRGQVIDDRHVLYVSLENNQLTVAAYHPTPVAYANPETIAVALGFPSSESFEGVIPASLRKLLKKMQDIPHAIALQDDHLAITSDTFSYQLRLQELSANITKSYAISLNSSHVRKVILDVSNNHGANQMTITTATLNTIRHELTAMIEQPSAIVAARAELKGLLQAEIKSAVPVAQYDALLGDWKAKRAQKATPKVSKLDLLTQAMQDGITDIDTLAEISGMKPGGVKAWIGVIRSKGLANWRKRTAARKAA